MKRARLRFPVRQAARVFPGINHEEIRDESFTTCALRPTFRGKVTREGEISASAVLERSSSAEF